ncbi:MAG: VOC family protein [Bacteroidota bacterium]|nr:VOC family protein [Bacteroidota bacterium]
MKLIPYLNFAGNTEDALNFYQKVFEGTVSDVNRFGEMLPAEANYQDKIMHARLAFGDNMLMFSDGMPGQPVDHGNGIYLSIGLDDEAKARSIFDQLGEGGNITMPLEKQFWGALFGQVKDKYDVSWMINCEAP